MLVRELDGASCGIDGASELVTPTEQRDAGQRLCLAGCAADLSADVERLERLGTSALGVADRRKQVHGGS